MPSDRAGQGTEAQPPAASRESATVRAVLSDYIGGSQLLLGFTVAGLLVYLLGMVVGWKSVLEVLTHAELRWVAAACLSSIGGLFVWGKAWQVVLRTLGITVPFRRLSLTYLAATFANYVTPLGQAGGEPFIAYILSKDTDASYEDSLASVVTTDLLNLLPFFNFAAVGLGYLLFRRSLATGVETLTYGLTAMALGIPLLVVGGWRYRQGVERVLLRLISPVATRTDRVSITAVRDRIQEFYRALERITSNPRQLGYALVFSYLGWVCFSLPLYFAALALDAPVSLAVVLFIVPASTLAGLTPLPGGLAGVETALVTLLVGLTPVTAETAFAVALIYRVASYWVVLAVGGGATLRVLTRISR